MNNVVKEVIKNELIEMGFNFAHLGTTYIVEAIEIIYHDEDKTLIKSIERRVYPIIAKKHSKNVSTIKSNITKATNYMYEKSILKYKKTEPLYMYREKQTPKSVINTVLIKLED